MHFGTHMRVIVVNVSGLLCLVVLLACGIVCSGLFLRKLLLVSFVFSLFPNLTFIRRYTYAHFVTHNCLPCNTYCLIVRLLEPFLINMASQIWLCFYAGSYFLDLHSSFLLLYRIWKPLWVLLVGVGEAPGSLLLGILDKSPNLPPFNLRLMGHINWIKERGLELFWSYFHTILL
jgi:hypothetical protein